MDIIKVISVIPQDNYQIFVRLSNGKSGSFDVSPYLGKGIFSELKDKEYFSKVKILFGGIAWPNSQDFSGDTIEYELLETEIPADYPILAHPMSAIPAACLFE